MKDAAESYLLLHVDGCFLALSSGSVVLNKYKAIRAGEILIESNAHQVYRLYGK